jgi:uncharacterized membrane protein
VAGESRTRVGRVVWVVVGLLARVVGAGALFWLVFPLWLGIFWRMQGYPLAWSDYPYWYALGAFNAAPIAATVGVSILLTPLLAFYRLLLPSLRFPSRSAGSLRGLIRIQPSGTRSPKQVRFSLRRYGKASALSLPSPSLSPSPTEWERGWG